MIPVREIMLKNSESKMIDFTKKLIPGNDRMLGIRIPILRELAKEIVKEDWRSFLDLEVTEYHEDRVLWGLVVYYAKMEFDERLSYIERFIPKITNWAVCDTFGYKAKKNERPVYWDFLQPYLKEPSEYGMRFAVVTILGNFIDSEHIDDVLRIMNEVKHDGYYLKMAVAWTLSVCYIKFPEKTMALLKNNALDDFTYNKTLQKIIESFRVTDADKEKIRKMKRQ